MNGMPFYWDAATNRYIFKKDADVNQEIIARAEEVRAFVCRNLKIVPPSIIWICPAPTTSKSGPLRFDHEEELDAVVRLRIDLSVGIGMTPKNRRLHEVWIPNNLTAHPNLEYVVAHELRHAWQKKACPDVFSDEVRAEGDAYPYGYDMLRRYLGARGQLTEDLRRNIDAQEVATKNWFQTHYPDGYYAIIQLSLPATPA